MTALNSASSSQSSSRSQAIQAARTALALKPVFIDTETTGLDSRSEIIEIVVVDSDGSTLLNTMVKPRSPIPQDATRIHGITDEMVSNAPRWIILWEQVRGLFFNQTLAIYNAEFDLRMIEQTNRLNGIPSWRPGSVPVDIMKIYADYRSVWDPYHNSNKIFKLEEAGQHFRIPIPNSHRALDDTKLARELLLRIAESDELAASQQ